MASPEGNGKGLTCPQAVILGFQVPEDRDCVRPVGSNWVSDKNCSGDVLTMFASCDRYKAYQAGLNDNEELDGLYINFKKPAEPKPNYLPSIAFWDYEKHPSIEEYYDNLDDAQKYRVLW